MNKLFLILLFLPYGLSAAEETNIATRVCPELADAAWQIIIQETQSDLPVLDRYNPANYSHFMIERRLYNFALDAYATNLATDMDEILISVLGMLIGVNVKTLLMTIQFKEQVELSIMELIAGENLTQELQELKEEIAKNGIPTKLLTERTTQMVNEYLEESMAKLLKFDKQTIIV